MDTVLEILIQCDTNIDWVVGLGDGAVKLPVLGPPASFAYSRARACCACSRCRAGGLFFFFHLSSISNVLSFWRQLTMSEIL